MEKKKRGFLDGKTAMLLTLLGLLVVSGYINYRKAATEPIGGEVSVVRIEGERPTTQPSPTPAAQDTFAAYQQERASARAQELSMLEEIIADESAGAETIAQAQAQKLALVQSMETETSLEALLRARGFESALVSAKPGSVTVVVGGGTLSDAQAVQILDIAVDETQQAAEDIKIIQTK